MGLVSQRNHFPVKGRSEAFDKNHQRFHHISADLKESSECIRVIDEVTSWNDGASPDIVWCCAGIAHTTLFIDTPAEKFADQMSSNYLSTAYTAHAILRAWLGSSDSVGNNLPPTQEPRHLIFTSSILALYPIVGYAPYSPTKCALHSLADSLSMEAKLYQASRGPISMHTTFPATILTPGFDAENVLKSDLVKELEKDDKGQSPDAVASACIAGLKKGEELIATSWMGKVLLCSVLGGTRKSKWSVREILLDWVGSLMLPLVRGAHLKTERTTSPVEQTRGLPRHDIIIHIPRVQQSWNRPLINRWRLCAAFFALVNVGANDASYGALLPYITIYYNDLSYTVVSLVFLSPFIGYTIAALSSEVLHTTFGQRGLAIISPGCRLLAYLVISFHPPYAVVVAILVFAGYGNGLADAGWNAWIGDMVHANELLGILNGCYGLGAILSPLIATAMITTYSLPWYSFFYVMMGSVLLELCAGSLSFWRETGLEFRKRNAGSAAEGGRTKAALKRKVTWICAFILLTYVGVEVSVGGWVVTFMMRVRHGAPLASAIVSTGFWIGITLGRVFLGFVTPILGERLAVWIYLVCAILLEILFWRISNFVVSAVMVAFLGFFMGPLFCIPMVAAAKLLPKRLHVSAIGFSTAFGGGAAAAVPFIVGAIVNARGLESFQPVILVLLVAQFGLWLLLPKIPAHAHED